MLLAAAHSTDLIDQSLLDTDILSEVLKQRNSAVNANATQYLDEHKQFAFSAFTRFEIRRGYKLKQANRLISRFEIFCENSKSITLSDAIFERAADLWALALQGGHPHGDADLIIAATALEVGLTLVTGTTRPFAWIPALTIEDWR